MTNNSFNIRRAASFCFLTVFSLAVCQLAYGVEEERASSESTLPWLRLRLTQSALADMFSRSRVYDAPIEQDILGAWVSGTGNNRISITPRLMPSADSFCVAIDLVAEVASNTTSRKRAATIWSLSKTNMQGGKKIDFDGKLIDLHPAMVHGSTSSQFTGFDWSKPIGKGLAWRQALNTKSAAERESARKACRRAERELDAEVDQLVDGLLAQLKQRKDLAAVLGECDCNVKLCTTSNETVWCVRPKSLSNAAEAATPEESEHDVELFVDERLLEEVAQKAVGGKSFGEETWHKVGQLLLKAPSSLQVHDPAQIWEVEFASRPVDIDFSNDQINATLHVASLKRGEQVMPAMDLSVAYQIVPCDSNQQLPTLRRVGRPSATLVEQPKSFRLGLRQQIYRSMVRERVTPLLPAEVSLDDSTSKASDGIQSVDVKVDQGRLELRMDWSRGDI